MSAPREDPLAYNGWANHAAQLKTTIMASDADSDLMPPPIPVGPGEDDPGYEFENPAESWIALVEACRLEYVSERNNMVMKIMFLAKNSHWTNDLYQTELELLDDEYGGPIEEEPASPPPQGRGSDYVEQARTKQTARGRCPRCGKMSWDCQCL